ncbi:TetR/AcrR family transcriptional regulator [Micromonospora sp. HM5-17]|uniref:TetR/AcrR family transcriptional regulator n=1 Tax=Micromonospora sp. HM5-17 TaxID=2487710 RepID=UPI000F488F69|nr:TetR family transcriptional regulator [Micromonospora sp. HM5-17]ROT31783.1 TetR family transcriptional regulator [Micromonospora sp. HM5-17]
MTGRHRRDDGGTGRAGNGAGGGRRSPRPRDPQARRDALAAAVLDVVAEVGIGRTTHRAVAARAGLPLGATTYYFPTLDDLIAAGLRRASEALQADLRDWAAQVAAADDPVAALVRLVESYLADRNRARIEYELYLAAARDARLRPLAETWVRGLRELLEPHVGDVAARGIVALLDGVLIQALVTGADLDGPALATAIRRLAGR